mmetsp:Transcript_7234/g.12692  ORF Transcript_7234/g.12692 Transcript_7234/m.12692 type:complete len:145 (+) Transcript_7234:13-447(+)
MFSFIVILSFVVLFANFGEAVKEKLDVVKNIKHHSKASPINVPMMNLKNEKVSSSSAADCKICTDVTKIIHYIVNFSGLTGKDLEKEVESICQYVPSEYAAECQTIISVVGLKLAECVADQKHFNAAQCCYEISLCPKPQVTFE